MKVGSVHRRTIWPSADGQAVEVIDQTKLPHDFVTTRLETLDEAGLTALVRAAVALNLAGKKR